MPLRWNLLRNRGFPWVPNICCYQRMPSHLNCRKSTDKWHSFCWTWSTGEEFYRFYKDGQLLRHREINRERSMPGGGSWELGIRSEDIGAQPKVHGQITSVNVWNKVLPQKEIKEIMASCASKYQGNVKSWKELSDIKWDVKLINSTCCKT